MKKVITKIFNPNKIISLIFFCLSIFLLIYVFSCHLEETPLAYITYLISAYSLTIFCLWFYKACQFSNNYIKENSKLYKNYNENSQIITRTILRFSFIINLIYGLFKLSTGIYYKSAWFITFAAYYLLLCFMRGSLAFSIRKEKTLNLIKEYKKLKQTGIILLFLNLVLSGMIILIIHKNQTFIYPGNLIYVVALYDFYLIVTAIVNIFKHHKEKSPIILASKGINLTVAMISMISLEVAMIYQFGNNDDSFKLTMISITGFIVAIINSAMAIYMIVKATTNNKNLKK